MQVVRLKAKNQVTIPSGVVKQLRLRQNELLAVESGDGCIRLVPVEVTPRYAAAELAAIDAIVAREAKGARRLKPGKQLAAYIKTMAK